MERLRTWVEDKKLTYQQVAEKLGVQRTTVGQWISGYYVPSRQALENISRLTGLSIDELLSKPKRKRSNA